MNKIQIAIDAILCAAVIALFCLFMANKPAKQAPVVVNADGEAVATLPIAYLNLDSLLINYTFAQEAQEKLVNKQEDARLKLNEKMRVFQGEYEAFQRKIDNNAFLSRERAEQEAAKLQKKQTELQQLEEKLTQEIMIENQNLNIQMADSLTNFLKDFNADGRYQMILTNTGKDNVLMAAEALDITEEVIAGMNARYKK